MNAAHPISADRVVDGYRHRVALARAEARPVLPALLPAALAGEEEVVEFPCGVGHFLTAYAQAKVRVRLVDGSAPMLAEAIRRARDAGVAELGVGHHLLHALPALPAAGLMVVANGAFDQLAAPTGPAAVLARLREAVPTNARLLLQAVDPDGGGTAFYTPSLPEGVWSHDHIFTTPGGRTVARHRRQHHTPDRSRVDIEFTYTTGLSSTPVLTARVSLILSSPDRVRSAAATAGWRPVTRARHAGFAELLLEAGEVR
ncbi:class I SAM-dependent methyltransferase [Nocardiopsis sp. CC223A]|uniref:class I SAM-dependent methyltransferase n=1 Tax=Nocardiopsis sp. CC223A TaxID=3044051 RepID=UPI00278BDF8B|nr:class I SAM-dependent methyltransferase [Nocardiopsis sp. CC223A]